MSKLPNKFDINYINSSIRESELFFCCNFCLEDGKVFLCHNGMCTYLNTAKLNRMIANGISKTEGPSGSSTPWSFPHPECHWHDMQNARFFFYFVALLFRRQFLRSGFVFEIDHRYLNENNGKTVRLSKGTRPENCCCELLWMLRSLRQRGGKMNGRCKNCVKSITTSFARIAMSIWALRFA